jgi:2-oxo-3-hexenedioate decarboxylase
MATDTDIKAIAAEALGLIGTGRQVTPFTARYKDLSLADAYRITPVLRRLREARGEIPVGRKIGFTNRTIWAEYGVFAPIWGHIYNTTLRELGDVTGGFALAGLSEPRIEPEIVFGFAEAPRAGMDEAALLDCIAWVAHGFELVQSLFPGWKFAAADTVAGYGLHGAYFIGPRHPVAGNRAGWLEMLKSFEIDLFRNGTLIDRGRAANVLDGPLSALRHFNDLLGADPGNPPLAAGEIVTTGTLTRAFPVAPGETWSTQLTGIDIGPIVLGFI